nr:hypothetical protein [Tanacetum cinerariifolium]
MIIKKYSKIVKAKVKRESLALKAKKESIDEECSTFRSEGEEYAMAVRHFKNSPREEMRGSWSDSGEEADEKVKNETCLVAQASSEICIGVNLEPDEWIKDSGCSKHMTGNRKIFSSYEAYNGGTVIFGSNLCGNIIGKVLETPKKDLEDLFYNFYDEYFDASKIMKSSTMNVKTSNVEIPSHEEEVFYESSESFQKESSSSSLNDDVQQSSKEVGVSSSNTQSVSNNMVPNVDEASTSYNVFNEHFEDAYFDASTLFYDPSNVHTFYQPYPHEEKWTKDHPLHKIIGDPKSSVRTRGQLANSCLFLCLLSSIELANVVEALRDADWVSPMQEELDQFARLKVWRLVSRPEGKTIIKTKWIFKNKKDESSLDFTVFQMDVKITFLNEILKEEVYVGQPPGFFSKQYLDHVYALGKALYALKQAPRAWYDVLSQFLIDSGFQKGLIDTTLFIKKKGKHIMLIQIYVDDIIFGSTNPKYCTKFSDLMVKRFEMSMMGEVKFFLGLQVNQFSNGVFINQSKCILDILKRFEMENCDTVPTSMVEQAKLKLDLVGKPVDHTDYRSMIGSLTYVT